MPTTQGFVGTVEVETRGTARIWFSLTGSENDDDWVKEGGVRAWFTLNLEAADQPMFMAELALINNAMRDGNMIRVAHSGAASFRRRVNGDTFEVTGVRVLHKPMKFS